MPEVAVPLWAKGQALEADLAAFTIGEDPKLDGQLLADDLLGSAAHVRMLGEVGLLPEADAEALLAALADLYREARTGAFAVGEGHEDGHSAIEAELTARLGEAGKRVHLARSRNDQVLLALRLHLRRRAVALGLSLAEVITILLDFAQAHDEVLLPGYTHLQRAMPSSLGMWAAGFAQGLLEDLEALPAVLCRIERCPLGAAAGFGVPLPIDRVRVTELLDFPRVQWLPTDAVGGRGRAEQGLLDWLASMAMTLEKLSWDVVLYTSAEFGYFRLASALTTGSSIMPQKQNPDVAELLRGRCRQLRGFQQMHQQLVTGLPSSYHRDLQLSKGPLLAGLASAEEMLPVLCRLIAGIAVERAACSRALDDGLYATAEAYRRVAAGEPFRDAYRAVGQQVLAGSFVAAPELRAAARQALAVPYSALRTEAASLTAPLATRRETLASLPDRVFA